MPWDVNNLPLEVVDKAKNEAKISIDFLLFSWKEFHGNWPQAPYFTFEILNDMKSNQTSWLGTVLVAVKSSF